MSQYTINIGALPNDGTGDPLRTAFNETNLNFNQVFAAGPVLSNIQIANNTILTTNTNGNLILAPNGIGVVQSNVSIVPNLANIRNLGSSTQRWATIYSQYLNVSSGTSVNGDLTVSGNIIMPSGSSLVGSGGSPAPSINGFSSIGSATLTASGNVTGGNLLTNSRVISTPVALAGLTAVAGARAFVSDGNLIASGNFGAQIGGSGANTVPVWSDGVNWYIG